MRLLPVLFLLAGCSLFGSTAGKDDDDDDDDSASDTTPIGVDGDRDGVDAGEDCDDLDPDVFPGAEEICDGVDQDCDGATDEDFDADADGVTTCGGDCDDTDEAVHPGAADPCDGGDQDCDGVEDEDADADADGLTECEGDCDDSDGGVGPGATDTPHDGVDQDCDGADLLDGDGDGLDAVWAGGADCDDTDAAVGTLGDAADPSVLAGRLDADDAEVVVNGVNAGGRFGASIARVPDIDGDSVDDLLVGEPESEKAWLFSGAAIVAARGAALSTADARTELYGEEGDGAFGIDVSPAGDVDGDGTVDLLIGAYRLDDSGYDHLGKAYLFDGPDVLERSRIGSDDCELAFMGGYEEISAGYAVGTAGDPDGDGYAEILIAGPGPSEEDDYTGPGVKIWECPGARIHSTNGETILWDVSHDDCQEYQLLSSIWSSPNSLAGGVDLSGDGLPDWAYGLFGGDRGTVGVVFGSSTTIPQGDVAAFPDGFTIDQVEEDDELGSAVDLGCDVDGDGSGDLVAGARGLLVADDRRPGGVYVVTGVDVSAGGELDPADALAALYGSQDGGLAGAAVACLGDVDGDGGDEVLVGAPATDGGATASGVAFLATSADVAAGGERWLACEGASISGETAAAGFGSAVTSLGDLDGDGYADFAIGAPEGGASGEGAIYVFFGP